MKIRHLKIFSEKLQEQLYFYEKVLDQEVFQRSQESFSLKIGYSILTFQKKDNFTPYHIAFHIPAEQEKKALIWLKEMVPILKDENQEIIDFPAWKAKSIYFYDADKNVVEFISRKAHFPTEKSVFSGKSLAGISEIGVATSKVNSVYEVLNRIFGLKKFTGDFEVFCATGDDEGLFIVTDKNKKDWFPSGDKAFASGFEIEFEEAGKIGKLAFSRERIDIL